MIKRTISDCRAVSDTRVMRSLTRACVQQAFKTSVDLRVCPNPNANLRVTRVLCSVRMAQFLLKNSPKRTLHGVARAIVKLNSLRSPSPIMVPGFTILHKNKSNSSIALVAIKCKFI